MKRSDHTIRNNAIGGIFAGVVLLIIGKLTGALPSTWQRVLRAFAFLASALFAHYALSLPGWVWLLLAISTVLATRRLLSATRAARSHAAPVNPSERPQLDLLQRSIMQMFAQRDGGHFAIGEIAIQAQVPQLRANKAIEQLESYGLIGVQPSPIYGSTVHLTRNGRDYLLDAGMVS